MGIHLLLPPPQISSETPSRRKGIETDTSVTRSPMLAPIYDGSAIQIHQLGVAVCHVAREGNAIRIVRTLEDWKNRYPYEWIDAPSAHNYPKQVYLITNPMLVLSCYTIRGPTAFVGICPLSFLLSVCEVSGE